MNFIDEPETKSIFQERYEQFTEDSSKTNHKPSTERANLPFTEDEELVILKALLDAGDSLIFSLMRGTDVYDYFKGCKAYDLLMKLDEELDAELEIFSKRVVN